MSTAESRPGGEDAVPLPFPSPEFRRLDLRQSTIAWAIGLSVGTMVAAAVILAIAVAKL
ncbi:MAG: hypothetical protein KDB46_08290 [Solirubrobacterales bacterium]|nr:hypothetical protein [Solirubrobacterales bacterium]